MTLFEVDPADLTSLKNKALDIGNQLENVDTVLQRCNNPGAFTGFMWPFQGSYKDALTQVLAASQHAIEVAHSESAGFGATRREYEARDLQAAEDLHLVPTMGPGQPGGPTAPIPDPIGDDGASQRIAALGIIRSVASDDIPSSLRDVLESRYVDHLLDDPAGANEGDLFAFVGAVQDAIKNGTYLANSSELAGDIDRFLKENR